MKPTKHNFTILKQFCNQIPPYLVPKLAKKHEVDKKARSFSPWSHVVSMLHCQIAHSLSLNDICDTLHNHSTALKSIRSATPPSRNGLSHANKVRNADMAEDLFWSVLSHIQNKHPNFGMGHKYSGLPRRFKRTIYAVDSTTIQLVTNCMSWAKHRRRKAAAKCHMQLNLQTFLPEFVIVKAAKTHDAKEAVRLCANLKDGEIALFDKAYIDYKHLNTLEKRGVFWITRAKKNMCYKIEKECKKAKGAIISDIAVKLVNDKAKEAYPSAIRLVKAEVEVNGEMKIMTFMTNNFNWASSSICDLYRARWGVEVFFKQIKQTLQLADFLGYSENAVRWQVWTALLTYLLLRYISFCSKWKGSFSRLFTIIRGVLFQQFDLFSILESCGTARGSPRMIAAPQQCYLPGFERFM